METAKPSNPPDPSSFSFRVIKLGKLELDIGLLIKDYISQIP